MALSTHSCPIALRASSWGSSVTWTKHLEVYHLTKTKKEPLGDLKRLWEEERKGLDYIINRAGIKPGMLFRLNIPKTNDAFEEPKWFPCLFSIPRSRDDLWPPKGMKKLPANQAFMFLKIGTWVHPEMPVWNIIPCIQVLGADNIYHLGELRLSLRAIAKKMVRVSP